MSRPSPPPLKLLILGGTTEASLLAHALAGRSDIDALLSLAGRTEHPAPQPLPTRTGGFGGVEGLEAFLRNGGFHAVIDATHPFAAQMTRHAAAACARLSLPRLVFTRPAWQAGPGDDWLCVDSLDEAARALGEQPRRVFLTVGRLHLAAFAQAPQHHYVIRSIDPIGDVGLPHLTTLQARPPFDEAAERALLRDERIDMLVTKNSGGDATRAKLTAARALGVRVIMLARPALPAGDVALNLDETLGWIEAHRPSP